MKAHCITFIILLFFIGNAIAQPLANISYCSFYAPEKGGYIELYVSVNGQTVTFSKKETGQYQASIEVNIEIKQSNETRYADKYKLHSERADSIIPNNLSIFDLQRIPLVNGEYELNVSLKDLNSPGLLFSGLQKINLAFQQDSIAVSDIELIESYTKSFQHSKITKAGYDILPYITDFFPEHVNTLSFYYEIYNSSNAIKNGNKYLTNYYIESADNNKVLDQYHLFKILDTDSVNVILSSFNIEKLASGNYNLVVAVRDKDNKLLTTKKLFFQRSKQENDSLLLAQFSDVSQGFVANIVSIDSLDQYIRCLYPISTGYERTYASNQLVIHDIKLMQQYFFYFWQKRNSLNPEEAWKNYYAEVLRANHNFGSKIRKGYETDRGRVYLQYGPPNKRIQVDHESNTYPYEIWHYYKLTDGQSNKRFVFCNTDLVTNEYRLIHSDARSETYNPQWNIILHKRHSTITDPDATNEQDYYGGRSLEYYQSPR